VCCYLLLFDSPICAYAVSIWFKKSIVEVDCYSWNER
jgi:hypothetical protein